jgi:hypothetical protein
MSERPERRRPGGLQPRSGPLADARLDDAMAGLHPYVLVEIMGVAAKVDGRTFDLRVRFGGGLQAWEVRDALATALIAVEEKDA